MNKMHRIYWLTSDDMIISILLSRNQEEVAKYVSILYSVMLYRKAMQSLNLNVDELQVS